MAARTAQNYMKVAEWCADKNAKVALLPPSLLYLLSRSSTPKAFADDILKRIDAGECIRLATIRQELQAVETPRKRGRAAWVAADARSDGLELETSGGDVPPGPLAEAISIMARGLRPADFSRVREILISDHLVSCSDLGQQIVASFLTVERMREGLSKQGDKITIGP